MDEKNKLSECPICNQRAAPFFAVPCDYRKPVNPVAYNVDWCNNCGYGQVRVRPSKTEISSFYELDNYYTHNISNTNKYEQKIYFLDRLRTHISWRFDNGVELSPLDATSLLKDGGLNICEIGCGNGSNLVKFLDKGFSVTGVDPDPAARQAAKASIKNIFDGTAEELPEVVLNNKYDVVLMSHVLEHCLDINTAVLNVKRILKKGGVFIVETPNCDSYGFKDYQGGWPWTDIPRHLNFFTPSSLNSILMKYDFRVITTKYRGFCRQFSNSWLEEEEKIGKAFASCNIEMTSQPNYKLRAWRLLFKSIFSSRALKYDSVRLIAVNL